MPKTTRKARKRSSAQNPPGVMIAGVLAVLMMLAGIFYFGRRSAPPLSVQRLEQNPSLGAQNAPVTVVEYGDFG